VRNRRKKNSLTLILLSTDTLGDNPRGFYTHTALGHIDANQSKAAANNRDGTSVVVEADADSPDPDSIFHRNDQPSHPQ